MKRRVLEIEDALAERLAVGGELDRFVEGALGRGLALDRDRQAFLRQLLHQHGEAAILRAEQAVGGEVDLVEEQFGRVVAVEPDLVEVAAAGEAVVARLDQEQRQAARAAFLGGARGDDDEVGALAVGDVGLAARQPPAIAVARGRWS